MFSVCVCVCVCFYFHGILFVRREEESMMQLRDADRVSLMLDELLE